MLGGGVLVGDVVADTLELDGDAGFVLEECGLGIAFLDDEAVRVKVNTRYSSAQ